MHLIKFKAPILLVANKADKLINNQTNETPLLKPSSEELLSLGSLNCVEWICISAKNLEQVFFKFKSYFLYKTKLGFLNKTI